MLHVVKHSVFPNEATSKAKLLHTHVRYLYSPFRNELQAKNLLPRVGAFERKVKIVISSDHGRGAIISRSSARSLEWYCLLYNDIRENKTVSRFEEQCPAAMQRSADIQMRGGLCGLTTS